MLWPFDSFGISLRSSRDHLGQISGGSGAAAKLNITFEKILQSAGGSQLKDRPWDCGSACVSLAKPTAESQIIQGESH